MKEDERQNGPLPGHDKVRGWLRNGRLTQRRPPPRARINTSRSRTRSTPVRRRRRRSPPVTRIKHGVLHVHKDYEGLLPVCYYDTGLREGGPDDGYACFDKG